MLNPRWATLGVASLTVFLAGWVSDAAQEPQPPAKDAPKATPKKIISQLKQALVAEPGKTPVELPKIPPPDPRAALLPRGFAAEVVMADLTYPSSVELDDAGNLYVAEAGYNYGDDAAPARVWRVGADGARRIAADQLNGPITDLLWHAGRLYISHRGRISALVGNVVRDLVTDLPSLGDHHNNQMVVGPDGKIYFGQGTATNSGVVGLDNFAGGWLAKYPDVHDVPAKDLKLRDRPFETPDPIALMTKKEQRTAKTSAFQPFGKAAETAEGAVKANGTILRMNPDGSGLEVYAWGLRNPFGLLWTPDGKLLAADAGYDERGSRPIAKAPDCLWAIKPGAWYGFPDFAGGEPVTDPKFKSARGPAPEFLLAEHPPVEKPLLALPPHTGAVKMAASPGGVWGEGQIYAAVAGDMFPASGPPNEHPAPGVARIDGTTLKVTPFFGVKPEALGPPGMEPVATAGPRRPVDVRFSPRGDALYVADVGGLAVVPSAIGPMPRPFPRTGVIWRIIAAP